MELKQGERLPRRHEDCNARRARIALPVNGDPAVFDGPVGALATDVVDAARRWGPAADRRWHVDVQHEGRVVGDAERLSAALDALLDNAVKFTHDADMISILARSEGAAVIIEVADNGPGITPDDLPRIFDRFTRGRTSEGQPGTGLGLALVKAIVEAHGGAVDVKSEPGRGSTFRLVLPDLRRGEPKPPAVGVPATPRAGP